MTELITLEEFNTYKKIYTKLRPLVIQKFKEIEEIRMEHPFDKDIDLESSLNLVDYNVDNDSFDIYVDGDFVNWNGLDSVYVYDPDAVKRLKLDTLEEEKCRKCRPKCLRLQNEETIHKTNRLQYS